MELPATPTVTLQRQLRAELRGHYPSGRIVVAIDGIDGAGKTTFADSFARVLGEDGSAVFRARLDDFHRPRHERYARGREDARGFYEDSYQYDTFRRVLLEPFRVGAAEPSTGFQLAAFDLDRDAPIEARWVTAPRDAVLVVDGIFANRPELAGAWNWSLWLEVPFEVAYARMAERDGCDPDPLAPGNARYYGGQQIYLREARPLTAASAIVDNTDPQHPVRGWRDFC